jgi:hypothetical protein
MKAGFKVETRGMKESFDFIVVANYHIYNLVINWRFSEYAREEVKPEDVGMWKVKTFKK